VGALDEGVIVVRTRAAVVTKAPGAYEVVEVEVDDPRQGEIRIKLVASGLCHSDDHVATGDIPVPVYPICGGHEGAGIVEAVGPSTPGFEVGDHVVTSFLPACGRCRWCARGQQNLCDLGAKALVGTRFDEEGSHRMHLLDGSPVAQMCGLGTFAEHTTIDVRSAVKVDKDLPLERLCLLSCAVGTGFGSAVHMASVAPGDTVIVMGCGGVGMNAVQGAACAGATFVLAVDPIDWKRDKARLFGATHVFADIEEAAEFARSVTNGQGADAVIVTVGVITGDHVAQAAGALAKSGTVVVTALGKGMDHIPVPLAELTTYQKRIQGALFGGSRPTSEILQQVQMYREGKLKLDELVTAEYVLEDVAKGYEDLHAGKNIRGVIRF
jgi:NDMA-dependent alcohol dehydrogenase